MSRTTIEMAREAAGDDWGLFQEYMPEIHRLTELVRADERAQRKPLTMQERTSIVRANKSFHDKNEIDAYGIIDDVEAAHGIKENT